MKRYLILLSCMAIATSYTVPRYGKFEQEREKFKEEYSQCKRFAEIFESLNGEEQFQAELENLRNLYYNGDITEQQFDTTYKCLNTAFAIFSLNKKIKQRDSEPTQKLLAAITQEDQPEIKA